MDFKETRHPEHAEYPVVIVMKDGHVRGPFKDSDAAQTWATDKSDDDLGHPKVLVPPDQGEYTPPLVPNEGIEVTMPENASLQLAQMAAEIERLHQLIKTLQPPNAEG